MSVFRAVVSSDFHLGGMTKVLQEPLKHQLAEIEKVYKYAQRNGIEHVIIPGDLTHTPNMSDDALKEVIMLLLKYEGICTTYYVLGNHDVMSLHHTSLDVLHVIAESNMLPSFHVFKEPTVQRIDGIDIVFMPFPYKDVPRTKREPLVIAHIEQVGAIGDNGRPLKVHEDGLNLARRSFIISGHIHEHQLVKAKSTLYCGSLYQTNFGESLPKGFLEIEAEYIDKRLRVNYSFIPNQPDFVLENVIIETAQCIKKLTKSQNTRYKLTLADGVVLPKDITSQHTNIVNIQSESRAKVAMGSIIEEVQTQRNLALPQLKVTAGLSTFLKNAGHSVQDVKLARRLVKEACTDLNIGSSEL